MKWAPYVATIGIACPWLYFSFTHTHPSEALTAVLTGVAILSAATMLSWACEVAEMDVPPALALSVLALVAVLPEYAVDATFAYKAATDPTYAPYAIANMTGGNRILLGLAWSFLLLLAWFKFKMKHIDLDDDMAADIVILLLASLYALVPVWRGSLTLVDTGVYLCLYVAYLVATGRGGDTNDEEELVGPAQVLAELPVAARRFGVVVLFVVSAYIIYVSSEPFAESLVSTGKAMGIDEFMLVQYVAPLASESPEVVVTVLMVLKGHASNGIRALVSSNVNQWTLLVGTLAAVYSIASGHSAALPMDDRQRTEVLLTAAQCLFAVATLADLRFSAWQAVALTALFGVQVALPHFHFVTGIVYLVLTAGILIFDRKSRNGLFNAFEKFTYMIRGKDFVDRG